MKKTTTEIDYRKLESDLRAARKAGRKAGLAALKRNGGIDRGPCNYDALRIHLRGADSKRFAAACKATGFPFMGFRFVDEDPSRFTFSAPRMTPASHPRADMTAATASANAVFALPCAIAGFIIERHARRWHYLTCSTMTDDQ